MREQVATLGRVRRAGITVCSGGIIGMGESIDDRCNLLIALANQDPHPESVPINALVRVAGTPLAALPPIDPLEFVRMIATTRVTTWELERTPDLVDVVSAARDAGHEVLLIERPMPDAVSVAALGRAFDIVAAAGGVGLEDASGAVVDSVAWKDATTTVTNAYIDSLRSAAK